MTAKENVADLLRDLAARAADAAHAVDGTHGSLILLPDFMARVHQLREELRGIVAELSRRHLRPI